MGHGDDRHGDTSGGTGSGLPSSAAVADTVEALLDSLTIDERAALTSGADMWHGTAVPRVGLGALKVTDGPAGARGARFVGTRSACVPCGSALGATWNPAVVRDVAMVLGQETAAKRAHVLLAPTVNLHRNPLAGRNFECYSEDPHLTAELAVAYVEGLQSTGVASCIKHFVANDSEFDRHRISSEVSERALRELYLIPFEAAVTRAGVAAVMSAYNRLNGTYCAEDDWLLNVVLKDEWSFDGAVISDWWGTMSPASAGGGLDLEMPGPAVHLGSRSAERVAAGELEAAVVEDQARRVLRLAARTGALGADELEESSTESPEARPALRRAATEAIVLLRNAPVDGAPVLPLDAASLTSLAVIGPNAQQTALLGGGSAWVNPHREDPVLDGIRRRLGDGVDVRFERGVDASLTCPPLPADRCRPAHADHGPRGLSVDYFANRELGGEPAFSECITTGRCSWIDDDAIPSKGFSARVSGTFVAGETGPHTFGLTTAGTGRLWLGGELLLDNTEDARPGTSFFGMGTEEIRATLELSAGDELELRCDYVGFPDMDLGGLQIGLLYPVPGDGIERAASAARECDAAVVVVGLNADWETEGSDRTTFELPGGQGDLVRAVLAANPRTAVLVNAGAPVDLDFADEVPALAWLWYPGQEAADAVADVVFGDADPSGRLPTTLGRRLTDWPSWFNYPGEAGVVRYGEELFMGYRGFDERRTEPVFPFGHGGSYTTFEWSEVVLDAEQIDVADLDAGASVTVSLTVTNTGERAGSDVVQVYVHDVRSSRRRPPQELRAFDKVHLGPGATTTVRLALPQRAFATWDTVDQRWVVEPGEFEIRVARSSRDVDTRLVLDVTSSGTAPPAAG
jgi:beta-glucosidase